MAATVVPFAVSVAASAGVAVAATPKSHQRFSVDQVDATAGDRTRCEPLADSAGCSTADGVLQRSIAAVGSVTAAG